MMRHGFSESSLSLPNWRGGDDFILIEKKKVVSIMSVFLMIRIALDDLEVVF